MKPWKLMLLAAGIAGVIGLFLPLVSVTHKVAMLPKPITFGFTAFDLSFRFDKVHQEIDNPLVQIAGKRLASQSDMEDAKLVVEASRGAALAFAPALLMLVFGAIGTLRKKLGRVLGAGGLLLGLASIGAWIGLRFVIRYALEDVALKRTTVEMGLGAHTLIIIGALGILAGLGALVQPDRGK